MSKPARWSTYASLFGFLLTACGGEDAKPEEMKEDPVVSCTTLLNLPCGCPGGGYGEYACDGSCLKCPNPAAGKGGAASGGSGGTGAMTPVGSAGRGMTMGFAGRGTGAAGRGMTGANAPGGAGSPAVPPAGMAGMPPSPVAGAPGMPAAGSGGMMAAAGSGATTTGDVPASAICQPVSMWPAASAMFELEVLKLVNENRAKGWNCDTEGQFPAAGPLTMEPTLRCSARLHSKDMADMMYFSHDAPDGQDPGARMTEAGYVGRTWGENIAKGQTTPAQVVQGWMDSDGHCSNIMNATFNLIGVGYFAGTSSNPRFNSELYWTQNFGASGGGGRRP
jgi:uncharacterized protein YkwD